MKRFVSKVTALLLVVMLMTGSAFAAYPAGDLFASDSMGSSFTKLEEQSYSLGSREARIIKIAEKANEDVENEIATAQRQAEKARTEIQLDLIISKLLFKTELITSIAIKKIEILGGEAECEWVEVQIGNRMVLVDPLRIVRL